MVLLRHGCISALEKLTNQVASMKGHLDEAESEARFLRTSRDWYKDLIAMVDKREELRQTQAELEKAKSELHFVQWDQKLVDCVDSREELRETQAELQMAKKRLGDVQLELEWQREYIKLLEGKVEDNTPLAFI